MIRAIYSFMLFAFLLSVLGFGSEIVKSRVSVAGPDADGGFTRQKPILRSPEDRSEHDFYPRVLELAWEKVAGAKSYKVETEIQVAIIGEHSAEWAPLPPQEVATNHCQITFGGANWGRWRVTAVNQAGEQSQSSDWWLFHFMH
jgi:hypothetical protein